MLSSMKPQRVCLSALISSELFCKLITQMSLNAFPPTVSWINASVSYSGCTHVYICLHFILCRSTNSPACDSALNYSLAHVYVFSVFVHPDIFPAMRSCFDSPPVRTCSSQSLTWSLSKIFELFSLSTFESHEMSNKATAKGLNHSPCVPLGTFHSTQCSGCWPHFEKLRPSGPGMKKEKPLSYHPEIFFFLDNNTRVM